MPARGDDRLREEDCRPNVVHTAPSRAMLADALAQYLVWKQWRRWFLVRGTGARRRGLRRGAAARRQAVRRQDRRGARLQGRSRQPARGRRHEQIQQQIPTFTQNAPAYDVLMVADEGGLFGEYFPYRTWDARPVAGTQGLVPTSWHPALEQWGATQFQNRFRRLANRPMRPLDYDVWVAVRSIGEAATRTKSAEPKDLIAYLKSADFDLAAFKGRKLTYRRMERPAAPADPDRDRQAAGNGLAAAGLPAPVLRARHARHRQAGDRMPGLRALRLSRDRATRKRGTGGTPVRTWKSGTSTGAGTGGLAARPLRPAAPTPSTSRTRRTTRSASSTAPSSR